MKIKTKKSYILVGVLMVYALTGCLSSKNEKQVYTKPDYSLEDVRNIEKERILNLVEKNPVQALWRAHIIKDETCINTSTQKIVELFSQAYDEKDYFSAYRYYHSLKAASYQGLSSLGVTENELNHLYFDGVPGLTSVADTMSSIGTTEAEIVKHLSEYINGTVTIWVDQGIKVENGVGYADRVIGSGFFISKDGYLVTNYHVIANVVDSKYEGVAKPYIKLSSDSDTRIPVKVIGWDSVLDLALLKAEIDAPYVFTLGASSTISVGDKIYAIGSPVGLDRTLTSGIVSSMSRKLFTTGNVFQIDAAVNGGNSGGPCIDSHGRVQAIVFAGVTQAQGLNFAIPVEYLKMDLPMLFNGGERQHSWMGAYGHTKKEGSQSIGVDVQYVLPSGAANRSDITAGSLVTAINDVPVTNLDQLQSQLMHVIPETLVKVSYINSNNEVSSGLVYMTKRPKYPGYDIYQRDLISASFLPLFGMKLKAVSTLSSDKYAIEELIKGGIADESGFSENDPIEIHKIKLNEDKSVIYTHVYTKNRKKGYLDIGLSLAAQLDSPYYF
ncbi:MAG: S1C family serine protease [Treponema sp.]|nr:S1C family serine protease [Treponema sp.]